MHRLLWIPLIGLLLAGAVSPFVASHAARLQSPPLSAPAPPSYDDWQLPQNLSSGFTGSAGLGSVSALANGAAFASWIELTPQQNLFRVLATHNSMLGGPFTTPDILDSGATGSLVNLVQAKDRFNRIHLIWAHQYTDGSAAILYTRWENGVYSILRAPIPMAASPPSAPRRNTGIAVGPDGRVHVVWGRDGESLFYSFTDTGVVWAVPSSLPWVAGAADLAIGVSTGGQVFVAWCDPVGPSSARDLMVALWQPGPTWQRTNISTRAQLNGDAHQVALAADNAAGMRFVWDEAPQEHDPTINDIYYTEWHPGTGFNNAILNIANTPGNSYGPRVTVDALDVSHVSWSDDTTGTSTDFRIWYNRGSSAQGFGPAWSLVPRTGDLYSSSTGLDSSGGAIHLTYSLTGVNGVRDRYYTWSSAPAINTPTATPTSTLTRTPRPTYTPGGPTACPVEYTDVDTSNPFYSYIRCLACRGIVSGYSTSPPCASAPCFLPGTNVTRGQMAKFIANAAAYSDPIPSTQQTFTDVPPANPFWIYVERAALHGVISGYTSSPPCTTGVPCFLPGNVVTRGQTAKFVSNAAGYAEAIPSTQQTFTDMPANSPFWVYSERAYLHGVISGYTSSPPCAVAPCFLGGNAVTRGQTAKFIANAFYPACQTPLRR